MAKVRIRYKSLSKESSEGIICYVIKHKAATKQIKTNYSLLNSEWDGERLCVITPENNSERREYLIDLIDHIEFDLKAINKIIIERELAGEDYAAIDVIKDYSKKNSSVSFKDFSQQIVSQLRDAGRESTARSYISLQKSFMEFRQGRDISISIIYDTQYDQYEEFLTGKYSAKNTILFYLKTLRALCNRAAKDGIIEPNKRMNRSRKVSYDRKVKIALPIEYIMKLKNLDLSDKPNLMFARDIFMLSYYARGMAFIDMVCLKEENISDGVITYIQRVTNKEIKINCEPRLSEIIDRYRGDREYLLPFVTDDNADAEAQYYAARSNIFYCLNIISKLLDLEIPLTIGVARHSWAAIANRKHVSTSIISKALGHKDIQMTEAYLTSIEIVGLRESIHLNDKESILIDRTTRMMIELVG